MICLKCESDRCHFVSNTKTSNGTIAEKLARTYDYSEQRIKELVKKGRKK